MSTEVDGFENKVLGVFVKCAKGRFLIKDENGDFGLTNQTTGVITKYRSSNCLKNMHLTNITLKEDSGKGFGRQFQFDLLTEKGTSLMLMIGYDSLLAQGLLNSLANIEKFGSLELAASMKDDRTSIWLKNDGEDVKWKWNLKKNDANSPIPDGEAVIVNGVHRKDKKGNLEYDYSAKMQWFVEVVIPGILAKVKDSFAGNAAQGVKVVDEDEFD